MLSRMWFVVFNFVLFCTALADLDNFENGNHLFTARIYQELLVSEQRNFLACPLSADLALALLQSGAKSETKNQIQNGINLPSTQSKIEDSVRKLLSSTKKKPFSFDIATKLYINEKFTIKANFTDIAKNSFQADIQNINFGQSQAAADDINTWIEQQTNHKIQHLINSDSLDASTLSVLVNTIYMQGNWSIQFNQKRTLLDDFHLSSTKTIKVKTMHQLGKPYRYKNDNNLDAKFLEMLLLDHTSSIVFVLPNNKSGLHSLENNIERVIAVDDLSRQSVDVSLPLFEINYSLDLKDILINLGINAIFNPNQADLSGIAGQKGDLAISDILQKTYIKITEGGIEAAAATGAIIGIRTPPLGPPPAQEEFKADHPFLFFVKVENVIVFVGRYLGP